MKLLKTSKCYKIKIQNTINLPNNIAGKVV